MEKFKKEDFALDDTHLKCFQSLTDMLTAFPKAKISKDFYCPSCGKHEKATEDKPIAQSKLISYYGSTDDFYWFETITCSNCNKNYVIKNQNF